MKRIISIVLAAMVIVAMILAAAIILEASESGSISGQIARAGSKQKHAVSISGTFDYGGPQEMMKYINNVKNKTSNTNSNTIKKQIPGTKYWFQIRTYKTANGVKFFFSMEPKEIYYHQVADCRAKVALHPRLARARQHVTFLQF